MNDQKFSLQEDQRERLMRDEMNAIIYFRCVLVSAGYCWKNLQPRLERVPDGKQRFLDAMAAFNGLMDDLLETVPQKSQRRMENITSDYKIILAPQASSEPKRLILEREDANTVMDAALKTCGDCYKSDEEARKMCKLYKVLETYCPLNDYGNGMICQYGKSECE